jgi:hypothetical protein
VSRKGLNLRYGHTQERGTTGAVCQATCVPFPLFLVTFPEYKGGQSCGPEYKEQVPSGIRCHSVAMTVWFSFSLHDGLLQGLPQTTHGSALCSRGVSRLMFTVLIRQLHCRFIFYLPQSTEFFVFDTHVSHSRIQGPSFFLRKRISCIRSLSVEKMMVARSYPDLDRYVHMALMALRHP